MDICKLASVISVPIDPVVVLEACTEPPIVGVNYLPNREKRSLVSLLRMVACSSPDCQSGPKAYVKYVLVSTCDSPPNNDDMHPDPRLGKGHQWDCYYLSSFPYV